MSLTLALVNCGDDEDESAAEVGAADTGAEDVTDEGEATDPEPDDESEDQTSDEADGEAEGAPEDEELSLEDLADLRAPIRIVYEFQADVEPAVAGTIVSALDGDRFSARTEINGMASMMVGDGDSVVTCMRVDEWSCLAGMQPDVDTGPTDELLDDPAEGFAGWNPTHTEVIAGREAQCGTTPEGDDVCFDETSGMPLLISGDELHMEAIEVGSPSEDDFELPAEPGEGDMPGFDLDDLPDGFDLDDLPDGLDLDDLPDEFDLEDLP